MRKYIIKKIVTILTPQDAITRMCSLRLTNVQHNKNCFARDNFSHTIFVVELPNFHNT